MLGRRIFLYRVSSLVSAFVYVQVVGVMIPFSLITCNSACCYTISRKLGTVPTKASLRRAARARLRSAKNVSPRLGLGLTSSCSGNIQSTPSCPLPAAHKSGIRPYTVSVGLGLTLSHFIRIFMTPCSPLPSFHARTVLPTPSAD